MTDPVLQSLDFPSPGFVDLSARARFHVSGSDRIRYLNGQLTCNIPALRPGQAQYACLLTAKGKLCGDPFVVATDDRFLLDAAPELRESLAARLERYVVADDVEIADVTDATALFHVANFSPDLVIEETIVSRSERFGFSGHDLWIPTAALGEQQRQRLLAQMPEISDAEADLLRIERGVPRWGAELTETTLPMEAGIESRAVDFHKGCYIGQEIVSRLRSVGHVNRHLRKFLCRDKTELAPLAPGMKLFTSDLPPREVGHLTSTARSFALDKSIALGYVKSGWETTGTRLEARSQTDPAQNLPVEVQLPTL